MRRKNQNNRKRKSYTFMAFRPGNDFAREIPAVASDLRLSIGALIRRALADFFYSAALDSLFSISSEQNSNGGATQ
jgi:hypothetical protein